MPVIESRARITRRYLMNKTKHGICDVVELVLRENDRLQRENDKLRLRCGIELETSEIQDGTQTI